MLLVSVLACRSFLPVFDGCRADRLNPLVRELRRRNRDAVFLSFSGQPVSLEAEALQERFSHSASPGRAQEQHLELCQPGIIRTTMKGLLRKLVLVRLDRASRSLAAPVDDAHARLLTNVLEEGERTLALWHAHSGALEDESVASLMRAWRRLVSYERTLWGTAELGSLGPDLDWQAA